MGTLWPCCVLHASFDRIGCANPKMAQIPRLPWLACAGIAHEAAGSAQILRGLCVIRDQLRAALENRRCASMHHPRVALKTLHWEDIPALMALFMISWLRTILGQIARWFHPPRASVDRSRLVGMYLSQANQAPDLSTRGAPTRERQDGKFAQIRRRG